MYIHMNGFLSSFQNGSEKIKSDFCRTFKGIKAFSKSYCKGISFLFILEWYMFFKCSTKTL